MYWHMTMTLLALVQRCYVAWLFHAPVKSSEADMHFGYTLSLERAPGTCGHFLARIAYVCCLLALNCVRRSWALGHLIMVAARERGLKEGGDGVV